MNLKKVNKDLKKVKEQEEEVQQFYEALSSMATIDDKQKMLWIQVYKNAIEDRELARDMFEKMVLAMTTDNPAEHQLSGPVIVKYIERMSKANEQILKLAELLSKIEEKKTEMTPNQIYDQIDS